MFTKAHRCRHQANLSCCRHYTPNRKQFSSYIIKYSAYPKLFQIKVLGLNENYIFYFMYQLVSSPMGSARGFTPGVKLSGCEADYSTPSSVKIKKAWGLYPEYIFMAWCLVKQEIRLHGVVLS
jgi:hypothetical protein